MAAVRSGLYNYRKWLHNPRYWIIAVLMILFSDSVASAFRRVADLSGTRLSVWLLPFLLYDRYLQFCVALCLIMLFCDAPFLDRLQPYCLQRIGRRQWLWGQVVYILSCGALFFLFSWLCLILLCCTKITWTAGWGSCLEMLARDNPFLGAIASELILKQGAVEVTLRCLVMGSMVAVLLGVFLMYVNLRHRRETGAMIAAGFSVLDFVLYSYFDQVPALFWVSPISWINPQQYTGENSWKWGVRIGITLVLLAMLIVGNLKRIHEIHIEISPEI